MRRYAFAVPVGAVGVGGSGAPHPPGTLPLIPLTLATDLVVIREGVVALIDKNVVCKSQLFSKDFAQYGETPSFGWIGHA